MIEIEWTSRAFAVLENLSQATAFEIIRQIDVLPHFPEIGAKLENKFSSSKDYRQLIVKRNYRVYL